DNTLYGAAAQRAVRWLRENCNDAAVRDSLLPVVRMAFDVLHRLEEIDFSDEELTLAQDAGLELWERYAPVLAESMRAVHDFVGVVDLLVKAHGLEPATSTSD